MPILIVEDEKKISDILKKALKSQRYSIDVAEDGEIALEKSMRNTYSVILLDIRLPKKDGFAVCRELRELQVQTPIIMLTALGGVEDRVLGLNAGADDYLIKPFSLEELFARIRAVLRRRRITGSDIVKIDDLVMDKKKYEVTRAGKVIHLTPKEYMLLGALLSSPGEAITRRKLIDQAWGPEFKENNNELNVHMKYLRNKIDGSSKKTLIHTIRGVGFIIKESWLVSEN